MASHLANGEYGEKVKKQQKIWKKIDYPVDVRKREFQGGFTCANGDMTKPWHMKFVFE